MGRPSKRGYNTFGSAVSSALAERGLTQTELAGSVGTSPAYLNRTMSGEKPASAQWVNLVAGALQLSAEQRALLHRAAAKDHGFEIDLGEYEG